MRGDTDMRVSDSWSLCCILQARAEAAECTWEIYPLKKKKKKRYQDEDSMMSHKPGCEKRQRMSKRVSNPTRYRDIDENKSKRIIPECDEM